MIDVKAFIEEGFFIYILIAGIILFIVFANQNTKPKNQPKNTNIPYNYPTQNIPTVKPTPKPEPIKKQLYVKKKLLTRTEIAFGQVIKKAIPEGYFLRSQICLASILTKTEETKYVNELFRIVDFAVFDNEYNPILVIEINDNTHNQKKRIARDYKVKDICDEAQLPLIKFWTDYGINEAYIEKRIKETLNIKTEA